MKKWITAIICLCFVFVCSPSITYPEEDGWGSDNLGFESGSIGGESYIEHDKWDSDRVNIKSGSYETEGYIKSDRWESGRSNVYDKNDR